MRRDTRCFGGNRVCSFLTLYLAVFTHLILYSQIAAYSITSATAELSNKLGLQLYHELLSQKDNSQDNIVISPLGMTLALGVARLEAKGHMAKEMDRIIEWSPRTIHRQLKILRNRVTIARNDKVHFQVRNLLFGNGKHPFGLRAKFRKVIKYYSARIKLKTSLNPLKKLEHNKKDLWQKLNDPNTKTLFISRVKFDAHWEVPFCVFKRSSFSIPRHDGSLGNKTVLTQYMSFISDENTFNYYNDQENNCQVIELNYGNDHVIDPWEPRYNPADISIVIALPSNGHTLRKLEEDLTLQKVDNWLTRMKPTNLAVSIPRFNLSRVNDVATLFKNLTTENLSTDPRARNQETISSLWEESSLAVTETGTSSQHRPEGLSIALMSKPKKTFFANHPFLFLVRDKITESILYLGRVVNPNMN